MNCTMKTTALKTTLCCFATILFVAAHTSLFSQNEVAIGSSTTQSNAILWLNGNGSQGLILPIVTNKTAVSNPDKGMVVYDDSDNKVWYRSGSAWVEVGGGATSSTNLLGSYLGLVSPDLGADNSNPHQIMAVGNGEMWVYRQWKRFKAG